MPAFRFGRLAFGQTFLLLTVALGAWRSVWVTLDPGQRLRKRVLVLGVGPDAAQIVALRTTGAQPFDVLGFLDDAPEAPERVPNGCELLGKSRDLLSLVDELRPDLVLVALADMRRSFPAEDLLECRLRGIGVEDWLTFYEKQTGKILVTNLRPSWLIFSDGFVKTQLTRALKRSVDLVLSVIGLALFLVALAVLRRDRCGLTPKTPRVLSGRSLATPVSLESANGCVGSVSTSCRSFSTFSWAT